jgi:hypothetical protein
VGQVGNEDGAYQGACGEAVCGGDSVGSVGVKHARVLQGTLGTGAFGIWQQGKAGRQESRQN